MFPLCSTTFGGSHRLQEKGRFLQQGPKALRGSSLLFASPTFPRYQSAHRFPNKPWSLAHLCVFTLFPLPVVNLSSLPCPANASSFSGLSSTVTSSLKPSLTLSDEKPLLLQAPTGLHAPIFVSYVHLNKLPQTGWLKMRETYFLVVQGAEIWNRGVSRATLSLKPQSNTLFHGFLLASRVAGNPWQSLACMCINLCFHVLLPCVCLCLCVFFCLL